jgi:hypothetical protein
LLKKGPVAVRGREEAGALPCVELARFVAVARPLAWSSFVPGTEEARRRRVRDGGGRRVVDPSVWDGECVF